MPDSTKSAQGSGKGKDTPLKGFLSYFYGNFVVLLLGFIATPLLTRILSTDEYGKTGMFETAVSVIYIFAILGLDQAYIRYYYKNDINREALLKRCLAPAVGIITALSVVYIIFSEPANLFLFGGSGTDVIILVIIYAYISVFERFFFLDVRMQQNGRLYSNINITEKVLSILAIIAAFQFFGNDFRVGLYALVIPWGSTTLFLIIRYFYLKSRGRFGQDGTFIPSYRELAAYGIPFITVLLMEWALSSCDRLALRVFSDFDELGIYTSAMKIIVLLLTFKNTFIAYWSPVAMERLESGVTEENKAFFRRAYEMVVFLCVAAAVCLILFRRVVVLLLGPEYREAGRVIPFLTLMPIFAMMFEITNQSIKFAKKGRYLNIASLAAIVINIAGNILLVPLFGGTGAALTTGVSYFVYFALGSYFAEKCISIGYDHKKTVFYSVLLFLYCAEVSFINNAIYDTIAGAILLITAAIIDRKSVDRIVSYAKGFITKK